MAGSSVIGALRVNLGLDAAKFVSGLTKSRSNLLKFAGRAGKIAGGMATSVKSAMVAMGVSAVDAANEVERLSQVANTAPQTFQRWAAGAQSVGIEQEKLADILKDVNDHMGDFMQTGGGQMKDFFDNIAPKVGVTAKQFRGLSGADALQLYVSSLEKANLSQQEMTFYMEAIASDSTLLLPLLENGGKKLKAYGDQAQAVGAVMDNRMIASLKSGKDALTRMNLAVKGMKNTIGAEAVPAIRTMSAAVTEAATFLHDHAAEVSEAVRTLTGIAIAAAVVFAGQYAIAIGVKAVKAMKALAASAVLLRSALISTGIGAVVVLAGYLIGKFIELVSKTGDFGEALSLLGEVASGVWEGIVESSKAIPIGLSARWASIKADFLSLLSEIEERWYKFLVRLGNSAKAAGADDAAKAIGDVAEGVGESWDEMRDSAAAASQQAQDLADAAADQFGAGFEKVKASLGKLKTVVGQTTDSLGNFGGKGGSGTGAAGAGAKKLQDVLKRLKDQYKELKATFGMTDLQAQIWKNQNEAKVSANSKSGQEIAYYTTMNEKMSSLKQATQEWQQSISSAFGSFITGASSFKEMIAQIIGKLGEMAMNAAFQNVFAGSSGWMGSILSAFGIGANATGTAGWRGGLSRINEQGGEIVDLPSGTRIIPHDVSSRMAESASDASSGTSVQVVPSPLFDVRVSQISNASAARMGSALNGALPQRVAQITSKPRRKG